MAILSSDEAGGYIISLIDNIRKVFIGKDDTVKSAVLALFADDKLLQRPLTLKTVRVQYSDLFKHSTERWVEFRGLNWDKHGKESRGKGTLRTSLRVLPGWV